MVEKTHLLDLCGAPNVSYKEYKDAKRLFRRVHRLIVGSYLPKVHGWLKLIVPCFGAKLISVERNLHLN